MTSSSARGAVEREVRHLLTRLATGEMLRQSGGDWILSAPSGASSGHVEPVPAALIEFCLKANLLERRADAMGLSLAGEAWLRRADPGSDDIFRAQHQLWSLAEREVEGTRRAVVVNDAESPLGWLRSRKDRNGKPLISDEQFEAGERLRRDYWFAQLSPRVTASWEGLAPAKRLRRSAPSRDAAFSDNALAAKQRVMHALAAVGPELSGILVDVCCELRGLEEAEKVNGWPQRAGKVVLQLALTRLAKHYGIGRREGPAPKQGRLRHWGTDDYRPTLDAWRAPKNQ